MKGDTTNEFAAIDQMSSGSTDGFEVRRLAPGEDYPWDLLLLADPSREWVERYLANGDCYAATLGGALIGEFVLLETGPRRYEIMNVAVAERYQGQGWGKRLVQAAIEEASRLGAKTVEVGTGNSSLLQLGLYQKCGFRIVGVETRLLRAALRGADLRKWHSLPGYGAFGPELGGVKIWR